MKHILHRSNEESGTDFSPTSLALVPAAGEEVTPRPALAVVSSGAAGTLAVAELLGQVQLIQNVLKVVMREGEHYGRIPGCGDRPTLLKPGAEKLCLTFRLAPTYDVVERDLERGNREYRVTVTLRSILTGALVGQGVGVCTSLEAKYRFRQGQGEPTDKPVPRAYWDLRQEDPAKAQELIGGKGFSTRKIEGKGWMICRGGEKVENDNPADVYNTVLKMAKKRALVDAVLTATAASDIFTQDLEDISANLAALQPAPTASTARSGQVELEDGGGEGIGATEAAAEPVASPVAVDVTIHFGQFKGRRLGELAPHQVHWLKTVWAPKRKDAPDAFPKDRALLVALAADRAMNDEPSPAPRTATADAA